MATRPGRSLLWGMVVAVALATPSFAQDGASSAQSGQKTDSVTTDPLSTALKDEVVNLTERVGEVSGKVDDLGGIIKEIKAKTDAIVSKYYSDKILRETLESKSIPSVASFPQGDPRPDPSFWQEWGPWLWGGGLCLVLAVLGGAVLALERARREIQKKLGAMAAEITSLKNIQDSLVKEKEETEKVIQGINTEFENLKGNLDKLLKRGDDMNFRDSPGGY